MTKVFCLFCLTISAGPLREFTNPALLMERPGTGFSASLENLFRVPGLYAGESFFHFPLKSVQAGVGSDFLKVDTLYQEGALTASLARTFQKMDMGAAFRLKYASAGTGIAPALNFGLAYRPIQGLAADVAAAGLWFRAAHRSLPAPPPVISLGVDFSRVKHLKSRLGFEFEEGFPVSLLFNQEVRLLNALALKVGFQSEPLRFILEARVLFNGWHAGALIRTHSQLGLSHQGGFGFETVNSSYTTH